jgi:hypothetical protein
MGGAGAWTCRTTLAAPDVERDSLTPPSWTIMDKPEVFDVFASDTPLDQVPEVHQVRKLTR